MRLDSRWCECSWMCSAYYIHHVSLAWSLSQVPRQTTLNLQRVCVLSHAVQAGVLWQFGPQTHILAFEDQLCSRCVKEHFVVAPTLDSEAERVFVVVELQFRMFIRRAIRLLGSGKYRGRHLVHLLVDVLDENLQACCCSKIGSEFVPKLCKIPQDRNSSGYSRVWYSTVRVNLSRSSPYTLHALPASVRSAVIPKRLVLTFSAL